jgi:hypothetical protein
VFVRLGWDGTTDDGTPAPDGRYRVRVDLRSEGRSITVPGAIVVDRAPPAVSVARVGPRSRAGGPVVLPARGGEAASVRLRQYVSRPPVLLVYRTDGPRPTLVAVRRGRPGGGGLRWEGKLGDALAPAGTYLLAVRVRDLAGNVATVPAPLPPQRGRSPRGLGVTVSYLAVSSPMVPVAAGGTAAFRVETRQGSYTWALRRLGSRRPLAAGGSHRSSLAVRLPARRVPAGAYVLTVRSGQSRVAAPFAVAGGRGRRVLVVLPSISWLGRDPVDDDGDGFPDTLSAGDPVPIRRAFAAEPAGFSSSEAPLLSFAARSRRGYDVTTDLGLALGRGPRLAGHRGVALAGAPEWEPPSVAGSLRGYVRRGGRLLVLGAGALRRTLTLVPGRLVNPSASAPADVFGIRLGPLRPESTTLSADSVGAAGVLDGVDPPSLGRFDAFEEVLGTTGRDHVVAAADARRGRPVISAVRVGHGLVLRVGLPQWAGRSARDHAVAAAMRKLWTLLER